MISEEDNIGLPPLSSQDILACQFSSWFSTFRNLPEGNQMARSNVTIKSIVITNLPEAFLRYLNSDGVRLPNGCKVSTCISMRDDAQWSSDDDDEQNVGDGGHDDAVDSEQELRADEDESMLTSLAQDIDAAIVELGGAVFPKLSWSSPKDASWINGGSLKATTAGDVFLLLKSSDFVVHDIHHAFDQCIGRHLDQNISHTSVKPREFQHQLVLRKWCHLHPSGEFRCFVFQRNLIAISQRNHTQHFEYLENDILLMRSLLLEFFEMAPFDQFPIPNYVFDVYVDKRERVWLVDFNVFAKQTDSLLFDWDELMEVAIATSTKSGARDSSSDLLTRNERPQLRIVNTKLEVQQDPLSSYRAPIDTVDLAGIVGGDNQKFQEFMLMCSRPSEDDDGD